jgi:hypothetical protein
MAKKAQEGHLEEGKNHKTNKWQEKRQTKKKVKKSLNSNSKLPLTLSM